MNKPILFALLTCISAYGIDYQKEFRDRDACLIISEINSGKAIAEHNLARCEKRFSPCSTFKIAAALMGFETGKLRDENQIIKWDGKKQELQMHNQDKTPYTWMSDSVVWVTQWLMPQIGLNAIRGFLDDFAYGNKDFSGGLTEAWLVSSLKISAVEQSAFLTKLWKEKLKLSKRTFELTKKIIFIKNLGKTAALYGKTGTGCLSGHECLSHPDKMLGWFVGILKNGAKEYVLVANASDLKPESRAAGPRLRETVISIIKTLGIGG